MIRAMHRSCSLWLFTSVLLPVAACTGGGPPTREYDVQAYELSARFDWEQRKLLAKEKISLSLLRPHASVVELDSAVAVKRVYAADLELHFSADLEKKTLNVDLSPLHLLADQVSFTVEYEANQSDRLTASDGADTDPVTSRIVYTDSEPDGGLNWLVANHRPSDRATWSVALTVAPDEDVIANGERVEEDVSPGAKLVRYEMADPIPTYLMAFAAGQITHYDQTRGRVPLSVWYRRGLELDLEQHMDVIADSMASFERLLGPYPFSRYSVVLVPEFLWGGMENATITFNTEPSGFSPVSFPLNAHELAHHWFGDWVTVQTFDDVWIKEGLATLLGSEAQRERRDMEHQGRLFGTDFTFNPSDSIRDTSLVGLAKYTSGPYQRAAWLLTQIRAKVGETQFWASLRSVLGKYALGSVGSEAFVRSFSPALSEEIIQQILHSLDAKTPPAVTVSTQPSGSDTTVALSVTDPEATLITPIGITVVDADGNATSHELTPGEPLTLTVPNGGYLAPDELDVHADWSGSFGVDASVDAELARLRLPGSPSAFSAFETRSAAHQERAVRGGLPTREPHAFGDLYRALDSNNARQLSAFGACEELGRLPPDSDPSPWIEELAPILRRPAVPTLASAYAACGTTLARRLFWTEFSRLASRLDAINAGRFVYLMSFDYGANRSFEVLSRVATEAHRNTLRDQAILRLSYQTSSSYRYQPVPAEQIPVWKAFFQARLSEVTSRSRFLNIWRAVKGLSDHRALPLAGQKLHVVTSPAQQQTVVCEAYKLASTQEGAWVEFQEASEPWDRLSPEAQTALADPAICGNQ